MWFPFGRVFPFETNQKGGGVPREKKKKKKKKKSDRPISDNHPVDGCEIHFATLLRNPGFGKDASLVNTNKPSGFNHGFISWCDFGILHPTSSPKEGSLIWGSNLYLRLGIAERHCVQQHQSPNLDWRFLLNRFSYLASWFRWAQVNRVF